MSRDIKLRDGLYETEKGTPISKLNKIERMEMTKYKTIEDFKGQIPEGATHYRNEDAQSSFMFCKFDDGVVYIAFTALFTDWSPTTKYKTLDDVANLIALEPVKQSKYVKVEKFSFDLKTEFEAGELYYFLSAISDKYLKIDSEDDFINAFIDSNVYRRVELTESDYEKGMLEAMQKIAISCGKHFGVDIGYKTLPDLVESLVNSKQETKEPKFKYEHVKDSIFDLKVELEAGELFCMDSYDDFQRVENELTLTSEFANNNIYRRVERTEEDELFDLLGSLYRSWEKEAEDDAITSLISHLAKSGELKLA